LKGRNNDENKPPVNVIQYAISLSFAMVCFEVSAQPFYKVIFEGSLNDLMQKVKGQHLVDISAGKVVREWLYKRRVRRSALIPKTKTKNMDIPERRQQCRTRPTTPTDSYLSPLPGDDESDNHPFHPDL
jgi:hypothetical protein